MLLQKAIAGCSTGQIQGLNLQLLERLLQKGDLVKIDHSLIICEGRQNNPYLQPKAYKALVNAVNLRGRPLHINSCLRTVMQQHMLREQYLSNICGIRAAAPPPKSNHQSGMAIDVQDVQGWKPILQKFGWRWIGPFDPMHFDYVRGGKDLGKLQVLEFQKLWNEFNPDKLLTEDGIWGSKTASAVEQSPADGFGKPQTLKRGDYSYEVGELQFLLRQVLGLSNSELPADCHFGPATEMAVSKFQKLNGLKVDGIAGPVTIGKLQSLRK